MTERVVEGDLSVMVNGRTRCYVMIRRARKHIVKKGLLDSDTRDGVKSHTAGTHGGRSLGERKGSSPSPKHGISSFSSCSIFSKTKRRIHISKHEQRCKKHRLE